MENIIWGILIAIIFFIAKAGDVIKFIAAPRDANASYDRNPSEYLGYINSFIRHEAKIEISKWINDNYSEKSAVTYDTVFFQHVTNSETVKQKVAGITNIIAEKISPELHAVFNKVYKKSLQKVDKNTFIDINLREYIARYVYFMIRKLAYDLTVMINNESNKTKTLSDILNLYIVGIENSIYYDDDIHLINYITENTPKKI
jgi:hypothetical protein